jgi:hypothetical protein
MAKVALMVLGTTSHAGKSLTVADDAFIFQPVVNYRTLEFDKALSARHIRQIVNRWADFAGLNQHLLFGLRRRPGDERQSGRLKRSPEATLFVSQRRQRVYLHCPSRR